jgi:uncharacterized protein YndB with AHSA1/START domain
MNKSLLFDFTVNKENKTVHVIREFDADRALVWKTWTEAELLDQWWAPKPYRNVTRQLELQVGGQWMYCMISPENEVHWCKADYEKVKPRENLDWYDAFCDEQGITNTALPRTRWKNEFRDNGDSTIVDVVIELGTIEDLEALIAMGFREGFTMGLGNLDELLAAMRNRK